MSKKNNTLFLTIKISLYLEIYFEILAVGIVIGESPKAEKSRHSDTVADTENVFWTVFVHINENSLKNCQQLSAEVERWNS